MEGFPAPDAKTIMEAMEEDESERTSANLGEDKRQDREIALVSDQMKRLMNRMKMMLKELVGDVQLADDDEDKEEEDVKNLLWKLHEEREVVEVREDLPVVWGKAVSLRSEGGAPYPVVNLSKVHIRLGRG